MRRGNGSYLLRPVPRGVEVSYGGTDEGDDGGNGSEGGS